MVNVEPGLCELGGGGSLGLKGGTSGLTDFWNFRGLSILDRVAAQPPRPFSA